MPDMITYTEAASLVDDLRRPKPGQPRFTLARRAADMIETLYDMVEELEAELEELGEEYAALEKKLEEALE